MAGPYVQGNFDVGHWYLQWGGKLPGDEEWSNGMRFAVVDGTAVVGASTFNGLAAAIQAFHASGVISSNVQLSFMKFNAIDVTGHYVSEQSNTTLFADIPGGGGQSNLPNQLALALTLVTGFSRGPAHQGRFYLPVPSVALVSGTGMVNPAAADNVKAQATTFLNAVNAVNPNLKAAVFSRKSGAATHRLVTGVKVGVAMDTQRRRRRKLVEAYR